MSNQNKANLSALRQQINSLPDLLQEQQAPFSEAIADTFPPAFCQSIQYIFLTGCGDSHHAALAAEFAFQTLTGLPCRALSALQFARYTAGYPPTDQPHSLLLAISVSGQASRTVEAARLAKAAGGTAVALTGNPGSPLAQTATRQLLTRVPPLSTNKQIIPGARSYYASQLALYLTAIHIGQQRGHLSPSAARQQRQALAQLPALLADSLTILAPRSRQLIQSWADADHFVFCGAGPNYGAALFSAAKILEASGDPALGQDMEEWAHLQFFGRQVTTPTILLSGAGRDESRTTEVATAARAIGRRLAIVAPADSHLARQHQTELLPLQGQFPEWCSPLLTSLAGLLLADQRAEALAEPYFRDFSGGRSRQGGGGISRIRTSQQFDRLP